MIPKLENMNRHARRVALRRMKSTAKSGGAGSALHQELHASGPTFLKHFMALVRRHGRPPHDREVAVAHEAGHMVAAAALGGFCLCASVRETSPGVWEGFCGMRIPDVTTGSDLNPRAEPERAFKWIVSSLAGIAAERVVGRSHPASAFEEAERARGVAARIAAVRKIKTSLVFEAAIAAAVRCIEQNFAAFEAVRAMLAHDDDVDPAAVNRVLGRVARLDDLPAFGGGA